MEILLNEAQDAILSYESKSLGPSVSVDSLSSTDTLEEISGPFEILKEAFYLGFELQYAFFYLLISTFFYFAAYLLDKIAWATLGLGPFKIFK